MKRDDQRTGALTLPLDHSIAQTNNEHIPQKSDGGNNAYPPNKLETKGQSVNINAQCVAAGPASK